MKLEEFQKIANAVVNRSLKVLTAKRNEYASEDDVLINFKSAGKYLDTTPQSALLYFLTKHLISLRDIVYGKVPCDMETIQEKITDAINYLILLEALFYDAPDINHI